MNRMCRCWLLLLAAAVGCSGARNEDYYAGGDTARGALQAALDLWKSGQPLPEKLPGKSNPGVQVQDQTWGSGAKLKDFQILEETKEEGGHTQFAVKLSLETPGQPTPNDVKTAYVVFGKDPLWVVPAPEFKKMTGG